MARFNWGVKPATLVAISWPLEVARSCIWFPSPAARDSGIDTSCCVPLPVETGMSRCWMGIVDGVCNPAWLVIRNCWATCGWPSSCWWLLASWDDRPEIYKKIMDKWPIQMDFAKQGSFKQPILIRNDFMRNDTTQVCVHTAISHQRKNWCRVERRKTC